MSFVQVVLVCVTQIEIGNVLACSGLNSLKINCHITRRNQETKAYLFKLICIYYFQSKHNNIIGIYNIVVL